MDNLPADIEAEIIRSITGDLRLDQVTRILYSTDASIHQIKPLGAVFPRTVDELEIIVKIASKYHIPLIPRGSGSSLAGQAIGEGLIIDCSRYLNKLVNIDPDAGTAEVEPGLILDDLNRITKKYNLQFGPDPASSERATMGGCIGNNATGAHSLIHGMTADHLISADVVLSDGSIAIFKSIPVDKIEPGQFSSSSEIEKKLYSTALEIRTGYKAEIQKSWPLHWRRVSGYNLNYLIPWSPTYPPQWDFTKAPYPPVEPNSINLAQLLVGSEGTLGILRKATLRLVPTMRHKILCVINFTSIYEACSYVPKILELNPSAVELIPQSLINLARSVPAYANQLSFVINNPAAMLAVEFSGNNESEIISKADKLEILDRWQIKPVRAITAAQQKQVWDVRNVGLGILMSRLGDVKPATFIEDMAVPVEHLAEFVNELDRILRDHHTFADYYGHASVGCLHIRPLLNIKTELGRREMRSIAEAAVELVIRLGGAVAAEHGDGITRGEWIERAYGTKIMQAIRLVKEAADPQGIFNPGRIVDTPPMDTALRYDNGYQANGWTPVMSFASDRPDPANLVEAIEQCNGVGVCRKSGGVMCPSFQATLDEFYSTRGRSNLLRAYVSHRFENDEAAIMAVKQTLEKCLACKGCKAECPSAVDVAKLKYEFYQHYYEIQGHRRPLRDYLFGYISSIAIVGHVIAPITNFFLRSAYFSRLREKLLGISRKRVLPKFARHTFHSQGNRYFDPGKKIDGLLLSDTFNDYFYPETGMSALRVLAACGCNVKILSTPGAGRTLISKGFLKAAKKHARKLISEIDAVDPSGNIPIIGLEPSEIYTLKDEYIDLFPNDAQVKKLSERAFMIDEFLLRPGGDGKPRISRLSIKVDDIINRTPVLLHGHCYQKAQPSASDGYPCGVNASKEILNAAGFEVTTIDDGCCGMAGAFGYERENYDLSMKVGSLKLFPAVNTNDASIIAAAGISCQSQIADGTGKEAYHPIKLIAKQLIDDEVGDR